MSETLQSLKELSLPHYLACLYLPTDIRDDIATLYTFEVEINRVPHLVSEPLPGEIRLQWWRDLIKSGDNVGSGPLATKLMELIARHNLPREVFHTYLEAKIFDLYQDPMPDIPDLEGYLGETHSALFQFSCLTGGAERSTTLADACGHGGVAIGLAQILSNQAYHRHTQRVFIPVEILEKHDLTREAWLAQDVGEKHLAVLAEIQALALSHLEKARVAISDLPKKLRGHFLLLSLVKPMTKKVGAGAFEKPIPLSPLSVQFHLLKSSILGT